MSTWAVNEGILFAGLLVAAVLFGITAIQASTFLLVHRKDPAGHKAVVILLMVLDLAHLAFLANSFFNYVVLQPPDGDGPRLIWSCKAFFALQTLTIGIVHCLYALRVWKLSKREHFLVKTVPFLLAILIGVSFALGAVASSKLGPWASIKAGFEHIMLWNRLNLGLSFAVDLCVAIILAASLHRRTSVSWATSSNILFVAYAMNTGMIPVFLSAAAFIAVSIEPASFLFLAFRVVLMTVHVNSLIAMFNARFYFNANKRPSTTVVLQAHEASININKLGERPAEAGQPSTMPDYLFSPEIRWTPKQAILLSSR
ncbi:hypothetical protein PLEOSDRAFT_1105619 [Pleurotus ostreatus PC15]|uniref:DUF6534 domain-containing protein n=1 Tax=Pleurotus ostreatus (strain PC15) TaxID=1137138 RepID=A0A067NFA4_PLEO1|nr:hypothetical protein PLEOSDRAFT_1105619 [Pleurotus ostreatus PC15]